MDESNESKPEAITEATTKPLPQTRHEILAELWGCGVDEAAERDKLLQQERAQLLARRVAAVSGVVAVEPVKPVKKNDVAAKNK